MFGIFATSGPVGSAATVATVLAESLVLYVGYGGAARLVGDEVRSILEDR